MGMIGELHVSDAGVRFRAEVRDENDSPKDISAATVQQFVFQKPDGSTLTKNTAFVTDGSDGLIYYTTTSSDLDQAGVWRIQVYLEFTSGPKYTDVIRFRVYSNLPRFTS
jgi:hypothetical protein